MKQQVKNFTIQVLDFFLSIPEAIITGFDRKEFGRILYGMPSEQVLTCDNISQLFRQFKRSGYIEAINIDGRESVRFTNKSRLALVDLLASRAVTTDTYLFISFDIPEYLGTHRDKFRRVIKRLGFKQIQKSLWVCRKDVGYLAEIAAAEYGVEDFVVYIPSRGTNIDKVINSMI